MLFANGARVGVDKVNVFTGSDGKEFAKGPEALRSIEVMGSVKVIECVWVSVRVSHHRTTLSSPALTTVFSPSCLVHLDAKRCS